MIKFIALVVAVVFLAVASAADIKVPAMALAGQADQPVSLVLGRQLLISGDQEDILLLDSEVNRIKLVAENRDFSDELKLFKKYRFQYAMYATIIFLGLFFVVLTTK